MCFEAEVLLLRMEGYYETCESWNKPCTVGVNVVGWWKAGCVNEVDALEVEGSSERCERCASLASMDRRGHVGISPITISSGRTAIVG